MINSGYLLKITSWECDADNYRTVEFSGLEREDVEFYIGVAKLFTSCNNGGGFGNRKFFYSKSDDVNRVVSASQICDAIKNVASEQNYTLTNSDEYSLVDLAYDLIDTWNDGEYWRVFDSFEVYYLPTAIENITNEFK